LIVTDLSFPCACEFAQRPPELSPACRSSIDLMIALAIVKDRVCAAQPAHRPTLCRTSPAHLPTLRRVSFEICSSTGPSQNLTRSGILNVFQLRGLWLQSVCTYCNLPSTSWTLLICLVPFAPCNPPNSQAQVPLSP
jgi:hypothetical protein